MFKVNDIVRLKEEFSDNGHYQEFVDNDCIVVSFLKKYPYEALIWHIDNYCFFNVKELRKINKKYLKLC